MNLFTSKITIFIGHYGTGKTMISVNLAHLWSMENEGPVALADIDVNNPYFRSRDFAAKLTGQGIDLIIPDMEIAYAEMPFLPARIYGAFQKEGRLLIDAGGYDTGTTVLGSLSSHLEQLDYQLWFTVNTFRPGSDTSEEIIEMFRRLQTVSRLKITGMINNSNLAEHTTADHVVDGEIIVMKAAEELGIRDFVNCASVSLAESLEGRLKAPLFLVNRPEQIKWESAAERGR